MLFLLSFAVTLFIAVLVSGLAQRSVLSVAVIFLGAGLLLGSGVFGPPPSSNQHTLEIVAEFALFSVLFTDGMRTGGLARLRTAYHHPSLALFIGMPLTIGGIAVLAHFMVHLHWPAAFLVGAVLSPTDPVFVSAIFHIKGVPERMKYVLNIESGLNDGLALPVVMLLLPAMGARQQTSGSVLESLALGLLIGVAIPWLGIVLERSRFFEAVGLYQPLNAFALGLLVLTVSYVTGANLFLAAFAGGITITSFSETVRSAFIRFGALVTELLKLAALLIFGELLAPHLFTPLPAIEYAFVALAILAVRPPAMWLALLRTGLSWREKLGIGWFGPKGFASVVYSLLVLRLGTPDARHVAHLTGLAVAGSIVVFSSTDILVGRWFQRTAVPAEEREQNAA